MQVSTALVYSGSLLLVLQGCFSAARGWRVFKNDATENIPDYTEETRSPEEPLQRANNTLNRAKQGVRSPGGRRFSGNSESYGSSELSCREVRLTHYVTDGSCRSAKPVQELVCAGQCVPAHLLPNSILRGKWWRGGGPEFRCVPAHSRVRRVQLHCAAGGRRNHKIRIATSCKCKRYTRQHNQSEARTPPRPHGNKRRSRGHQDQSRNNSPETGN
ncbi:sclerostin-like [Conger conger]|uniref:sclerostin-like n=1 Tax=Conger conger TaxID=82655 RepID=UPI002A5B0DED|nr:sclerostin-like [Conger conger]